MMGRALLYSDGFVSKVHDTDENNEYLDDEIMRTHQHFPIGAGIFLSAIHRFPAFQSAPF